MARERTKVDTEQQPRSRRRLNWGCGEWAQPGWINSDIKENEGVDIVADIRDGLPIDSDSIEYAVSIHSLPELPFTELVPALEELRRVLKPGGVLRLALPDLDKGIDAYLRKDSSYFKVPDKDAKSVGAKFATQMIWYGYSRSLFTHEFAHELLEKAGFSHVHHCSFRHTASPYPEIVNLDNREQESLFLEAVK
ncbi:MAG TPA: methyltransferase domain-containing protein [Solirubrobacterales bacterium]|nr:methyltransferase domain-containing protein [Solirubrobacterales bacterium]